MTHVLSDRDIFELNHKIFIRKMCGFLQYIYMYINLSSGGSDGFLIKVHKI